MLSASSDAADPLTYVYRPSVLGAPWTFRLTPDALLWDAGRRSGRVAFSNFTRVRMSYRPVSMQSHRFVTDLWSNDGPKLSIVSTSWKSMLEQQRLDREYSDFVGELHRRLAAAGAAADFEVGVTLPVFWLGLLLLMGMSFGLALLVVRALQAEAWGGAAIIAIFLAATLWKGGNYFRRNRPGRYRPDSLRPDILPQASA